MAVGFHCLFLLFITSSSLLPSLGLAVAGQEEFELVHLHEPSQTGVPVTHTDLPMVSSSVLAAEAWLRTNVLARYPSKNITTIVVGKDILCNKDQEHLLPAAKNLHYSLVRWGLVKEIKISTSFSLCPNLAALDTVKPFLGFLRQAKPKDMRVVKRRLYGKHHMPPPLLYPPPPPGVPLSFAPYSPPEVVPSNPPATAPTIPPAAVPASPPEAASVMAPPPCSAAPVASMAPPPGSSEGGTEGGLWCVAKPTVPEDKLQEAMDYACGEGEADCQEIAPYGSCFYPDNIVAHASYAFNSYWQKTKRSGGSCSFDGTAVLINSDPSFLQCRFVLS